MARVLEALEGAQANRMTDMQIGRSRIDAKFNAQGTTFVGGHFQLSGQSFEARQDFACTGQLAGGVSVIVHNILH